MRVRVRVRVRACACVWLKLLGHIGNDYCKTIYKKFTCTGMVRMNCQSQRHQAPIVLQSFTNGGLMTHKYENAIVSYNCGIIIFILCNK